MEFGADHLLPIKSGYKLSFKDAECHLDVDIMLNKVSEVHQSNLILQYALISPEFVKLAIYLKLWNKTLGDVQSRLNSFSITLMLVAFMQNINLLPNLQKRGTE
jgi:DNA polymerase sigma